MHKKITILALLISYPAMGSQVISQLTTGADGTTAGSLVFAAGGSWTGDGTVQPYNHSFPLPSPNTNSGTANLVTGLSSGVLVQDQVLLGGPAGSLTPSGFTVTHDIDIIGGSSNLQAIIANSGNINNYRLIPTAGATCITWTTTYSNPLHSRRQTANAFVPWLGSLQMPASANATVTIGGVYTATSTDGTNSTATTTAGIAGGLAAATINARSVGGLTEPTVGTLEWFRGGGTSETHINSIIPADPSSIHPNSINGAYTLATLSDANLQDGERVYADSITWVLKPDGAAFTGDEEFLFSFDGGMVAEPVLIPEPTTAILLPLSALALMARRKRA